MLSNIFHNPKIRCRFSTTKKKSLRATGKSLKKFKCLSWALPVVILGTGVEVLPGPQPGLLIHVSHHPDGQSLSVMLSIMGCRDFWENPGYVDQNSGESKAPTLNKERNEMASGVGLSKPGLQMKQSPACGGQARSQKPLCPLPAGEPHADTPCPSPSRAEADPTWGHNFLSVLICSTSEPRAARTGQSCCQPGLLTIEILTLSF